MSVGGIGGASTEFRQDFGYFEDVECTLPLASAISAPRNDSNATLDNDGSDAAKGAKRNPLPTSVEALSELGSVDQAHFFFVKLLELLQDLTCLLVLKLLLLKARLKILYLTLKVSALRRRCRQIRPSVRQTRLDGVGHQPICDGVSDRTEAGNGHGERGGSNSRSTGQPHLK